MDNITKNAPSIQQLKTLIKISHVALQREKSSEIYS